MIIQSAEDTARLRDKAEPVFPRRNKMLEPELAKIKLGSSARIRSNGLDKGLDNDAARNNGMTREVILINPVMRIKIKITVLNHLDLPPCLIHSHCMAAVTYHVHIHGNVTARGGQIISNHQAIGPGLEHPGLEIL